MYIFCYVSCFIREMKFYTQLIRDLLTYLLTYSMEQSPSWEAGSAASQEIPRIFWNSKVHHRTHPNLSQFHLFPTTPSHFLKIHLNIILPSMSGSPQWSLTLRFPHQNPVYPSPLPHTRHVPRPSHSSWFYHPHNDVYVYDNISFNYFMSKKCFSQIFWIVSRHAFYVQ